MRLIKPYIDAVFRHWVASMSGIASLAVGTAVQWRWIEPVIVGAPGFWWTVAGICFVVAMFQAWADEYKKRLALETAGPKVVLEYRPDSSGGSSIPRWYISNDGSADAINIESDQMRSSNATASLVLIPRLTRDSSTQVTFASSWKGKHSGTSPHPSQLFDSLREDLGAKFDAAGVEGDGEKFVEAIEDMVVPVRLTYYDATGAGFESVGRIHWNGVLHKGHFKPLHWGRRKPTTLWQRARAKVKELKKRFLSQTQ